MSTQTLFEPIALGTAQETMLIPLFGRAQESERRNGLIQDGKAQEIVATLDYDFDKWRGASSLTACTIRTRMFDQDVQRFLAMHPTGTVVEMGCGMNTRHERLHQGQATWIEVDLPEAIAWRRTFFDDNAHRRMMVADLSQANWHQALDLGPGPHCFVAEASVMYLAKPTALAMLADLAQAFPQSWLLMDTVAPWVVATQAWHDAMRHLSPDTWFQWACADPKAMRAQGLMLETSRALDACGPELLWRAPWPWQAYLAAMAWGGRAWLDGYRINQFVLMPT